MSGSVAITIGNFDGVHRGHAALLAAARDEVGPGGRVVAMTFEPHPVSVLRPDAAPQRLSTLDQRSRWLREAGADDVVELAATAELLTRSPAAFIDEVVARFAPGRVVEGPDFRFGRGRAGDVETLAALGRDRGFETIVIAPEEVVLSDCTVVPAGSSIVRWLLSNGRVDDAARCLDRPYELVAPVVRGDQRGRGIGYPTANLGDPPQMLPADGVYAGVAVRPGGEVHPAAISVGTKPTFGDGGRVCEAHLVDWDGPLDDYDWPITLRFTHWVRDQVTFADVTSLVEQIRRDVAATLDLLAAGSLAS